MNLYRNKYFSWLVWRLVLRNPRFRLLVTKLFVKAKEIDIEIFGSRLRIDTIKEIGYANAAKSCQSNIVARDEAASLLNLALIMEAADTFVDIGANVGLYTSIIGRMQKVFPGRAYFAFEANPDTFKRLSQTIEGTAIRATCVALSNRDGTLDFCGGAVSGVFGSVGSASDFQDASETVSIKCTRLDFLPVTGASLILKIDVEGHEFEVLEGAEGFFRDGRVKAVYLDGFKDPRCSAFLEERGFRAFDGRTLDSPPQQGFSVLWISRGWLVRASASSVR